nr:MAG TPA: hypothetical protein [Caudoviricetes sp.]
MLPLKVALPHIQKKKYFLSLKRLWKDEDVSFIREVELYLIMMTEFLTSRKKLIMSS